MRNKKLPKFTFLIDYDPETGCSSSRQNSFAWIAPVKDFEFQPGRWA